MQTTRTHARRLALSTSAALGLAAAPLFLAQAARAQGTITFENVPQAYHASSEAGGAQNLGGYYQGVTFTGGVTVFSTDAAVNPINGSYPPHSGTSEIGSSGSSFDILFTAPSTGTSFWYTNGSSSATVTAYLSNNTTQTYTLGTNSASNSQLSLAGSVSRINISYAIPVTFTLDDLRGSSFTGNPAVLPAAAVPEPSGVAAFAFTALGAAGLILRARRRHA